jgi:acyl-coenzyme A synthetase/AMP-(fatty) acid ligase
MLFDNLLAIAARAPSSSGLKAGGTFYPYSKLADCAGRLAAGFAARGVGPGMAVAIVLPNGPELFAVAYALFALGAIAVPLSVVAPVKELAGAARKAKVGLIVAHADHAVAVAHVAAELGGGPPLILSGGDFGAASLEVVAMTPAGRRTPVPAGAPALYLFSSGSTGIPKVVPHTHGEMLANARATLAGLGYEPSDIVFNNLPGNHAMGFLNCVFEVPEAGATTLFFHDPAPLLLSRRRLLATLAAERVTILPGVPFMFDALAAATDEVDLSALRLVYSAGVSLRRPTYDAFRRRYGFDIHQAYGCTEAGHVAFNRAGDVDSTWDSVGQPVGDTAVRIVASDSPFGPDYGDIAFRSSSLTRGYLGHEALNATAFTGGWFSTGDLGRLDADGNIFIRGRSKLVIEVAGHKVDPLEIEEVLLTHAAVAEVVVIGVPSPRTGEYRLKAVVVKADEVAPEGLIRHARERLSPQKVPTLIEFRDAIPKSATGKVLRGKLLE